VAQFLSFYEGDIASVDNSDVEAFLATCDGLSKRSQARMLSALRSFCKWLVEEGMIKDNPCDKVDAPKLGVYLPDVLSVDDVFSIINVVDTSSWIGLRDRALLEVLYGCGLRVSEAVGLKVASLFLDEGFVRVIGKGDKERLVPVGDMAIDKIFGGGGVWCPEDFGHYVTAENADGYFASYGQSAPMTTEVVSCDVPILMYHHLGKEGNSVTTTPEMFEAHLSAIKEAGYTAVTVDALIQYVRYGVPLPEKPVCITFDDGYQSNYEIAYPLLKEYGMCASVFVIGVSVGKDTYKDTGEAILPHFGVEEMAEMVSSGVIAVGSHTYDLHGAEAFGDIRLSMAPLAGEAEEDYLAVLREDIARSREEIEAVTGRGVHALAFPHGIYDDRIIALLTEEGICATFSVENGVHTLVRGLPGSLHAMKRLDAAAWDAGTLIHRMAGKSPDSVS
jgi:peptidoglycan/xylan/chitin deacetylase (PgdA/CDA1 family)